MLLTLTTTMPEASDLGYLVHKHPDRAQSFDVGFGTAHVVWPEASPERATVALYVEVDPIGLVRRARASGTDAGPLTQYVNDRPYAASSLLSVALGRVFRTALTGRCDARPDLAAAPVPLSVHVPSLPSRGGPDLVERLFAPQGWTVTATPIPLDPVLPEWGASPYVDLRLDATAPVGLALAQLYVLIPVLDDAKHYWVSQDEVAKLLRVGGDWLAAHPERELITRRYLRHQRTLVDEAVEQLAAADDSVTGAEPAPTSLARQRREAVLAALQTEQVASVVDLGCGEGELLRALLADPAYTTVCGADVSMRALRAVERRLGLDRMGERQRTRLQLLQTSLTYRDERLTGFDAAVLVEVIEHLDPSRLAALARTVFGHARPGVVVVTTPNAEHNVRFPNLRPGAFRHPDHRFEWTREQFRAWAADVGERFGYGVRHSGVGPDDPEVGPPTQLAVFRRTT